jgi:hypothetical protein
MTPEPRPEFARAACPGARRRSGGRPGRRAAGGAGLASALGGVDVHHGGQGRTGRITIRAGAPLARLPAAGSGAGTSLHGDRAGAGRQPLRLERTGHEQNGDATVTVCAKISHNLRMKDRVDETRRTGGVSGWAVAAREVPGLLPKRAASGRTRRCRTHHRRCHRQPGPARRCGGARGRRRPRPSRLFLEGRGWPRHRHPASAPEDTAGARHQPPGLPPAARRPPRTGQQRAAREPASAGSPMGVLASRTSPGWAECR